MSSPHNGRQSGPSGIDRAVEALAALSALIGGLLLTAIVLLATVSIARRSTGYDPILGDFEIVQNGLAAGVALFLPYCQLRGANIIVDFFTARLSARARRRLDAIGALMVALTMLFVAWRTGAGAQAAIGSGETTMLLGLPLWITYSAMIPGFALTAVVALRMAWRDWTQRA
jgi:TRAP-type C4-dicarboxylate transport system permease small subunit